MRYIPKQRACFHNYKLIFFRNKKDAAFADTLLFWLEQLFIMSYEFFVIMFLCIFPHCNKCRHLKVLWLFVWIFCSNWNVYFEEYVLNWKNGTFDDINNNACNTIRSLNVCQIFRIPQVYQNQRFWHKKFWK